MPPKKLPAASGSEAKPKKKETAAERMNRFEAALEQLLAASKARDNAAATGGQTPEQLEEEARLAAEKKAADEQLAAEEQEKEKEKEAAAQAARAEAAKRALLDKVSTLQPSPKKLRSEAAGSPEQLAGGVDQASVSLALNHMLGAEGGNNLGEVPYSYFIAGTTVDKKFKIKIWAREFVELGSLVHKPEGGSSVNMAYAPGSTSHLSFTPARPRQPANIYEWVNMFSIYAAIYCEKYPSEAPQLFTYVTRVMGITKSHPNSYTWRIYDEKFRRLRQFSGSLPWHLLDHHVLHEAQEASSLSKSSDHTSKSKGGQPKVTTKGGKFCYGYNRVTGCKKSPCDYRHVCSKCSALHPAHKCAKAPNTRSGPPASK